MAKTVLHDDALIWLPCSNLGNEFGDRLALTVGEKDWPNVGVLHIGEIGTVLLFLRDGLLMALGHEVGIWLA